MGTVEENNLFVTVHSVGFCVALGVSFKYLSIVSQKHEGSCSE